MECFLRRRETSGKKASRALSPDPAGGRWSQQQDSFLDQNLSRLEEETGRLRAEVTRPWLRPETAKQAVKERLLEIEARKATDLCGPGGGRNVHEGKPKGPDRKRKPWALDKGFLFARREALSDRLSRLDKELFRLQGQKEKQEENGILRGIYVERV